MKRIGGLVLTAALLVAPGSGALAGDGKTPLPEELLLRMADTPEEHEAVAEYLLSRAAQAHAEAAAHQRMSEGQSAGGGKPLAVEAMRAHCQRISAAQTTLAQEYEGLAKLHEGAAKGAKPSKP